MDREERIRLNSLADEMLEEARAAGHRHIYSASGFSQQNISIVHQQVRCANLAWALRQRRLLQKGDAVAIVGGSFSGLVLACSIALADDVIVYIIEKEPRLLHRFLDKSHRYLSPNLNSRDLRKGFDPTFARPMHRPAVFDWEAGTASEVAMAWLREYETYAAKLPIFHFLETELSSDAVTADEDGVTIRLITGNDAALPLKVSALIDATGFGTEANPHGLADHSYWEGGHRLIYDHLAPKSRILVSGCGDSGIIEVMHYAFADFRHDMVESFWPTRANLEAHLDLGLERINAVIQSEEVERYDFALISELCWWLDHWWSRQNWSSRDFQPNPARQAIFNLIENELSDKLDRAFAPRAHAQIDWVEREEFVLSIPMVDQLAIRRTIAPLVDDAISQEIASLMSSVQVPDLLVTNELRRMQRLGVDIFLNGLTPTPYTRNLSAYNIWLTKVLLSLPNVRYLQGEIVDVEQATSGKFTVKFADKTKKKFDRVVTRYGAGGRNSETEFWKGALRDPLPGDILLATPYYYVPTDEPPIQQRVEPAVDRVEKRKEVILRRRGSNSVDPISKQSFLHALVWPEYRDLAVDPRYSDPQTWLRNSIQARRYPIYRN